MDETRRVGFRKMNGLGNDFVVIDARAHPVRLTEETVRQIADREQGIGCDQVIVIAEPRSEGAQAFMSIWNADGGEVEACGNATRCIADLLIDETGRPTVVIETRAGLLSCARSASGQIAVDMGVPRLAWTEIPLAEEFRDTRAIELQIGPIDKPILHTPSVVNMGNPHCIFWVGDVTAYDLARIGPMLEHHPIFPERANISLAEVVDAEQIVLRVWERGAGLTKACGTAACAAAVAAARRGLTGRKVWVSLPGGDLLVEWRESDDHVIMTGPVAYEFDGALEIGAASAAEVV